MPRRSTLPRPDSAYDAHTALKEAREDAADRRDEQAEQNLRFGRKAAKKDPTYGH